MWVQIILLLHKIEGGKISIPAGKTLTRTDAKKVALDWMVTESEDMEDEANSSVSAADVG